MEFLAGWRIVAAMAAAGVELNSPLYQYLQDLGHTDFEVCSPLLQKLEECTSEKGQKDMDTVATQNKGILSNLAEKLKSWLVFLPNKKKDDVLNQLDVGFRSEALCTILQQEVLLQEDVELIELLDPSILSAGQPKQQKHGHLPTLRSLATPNIWDISLLLAFISTRVILPSLWNGSLGLVWGLGLLVYMCLRGLDTLKIAKLQMSLRKCHFQLEDIVTNCRAFTSLVRKALRLIQETEVISRGFTLVSAACPFNKAGQHPCQHLIGLRKAVYRSVRANFSASRLATLYMLKHYPLNSESDNVTNYICVVPFKELGLGLSEEQVSEEEAHNLTDGFSLPALKVLFQLWVGQNSEFFRRLVLLLSPSNASLKTSIGPEHLPLCIFSDVTQGLPHAHAACLEELKRSYEFYRYFETHHRSSLERSVKTEQKSGELNHLHTAVRSLQLHLKALLNETRCSKSMSDKECLFTVITLPPVLNRRSTAALEGMPVLCCKKHRSTRGKPWSDDTSLLGDLRVIILEDELEKFISSKESQELTSEAYHVVEKKLKLVQPHMQASNSCWEEAISQVEKMVQRNPENKVKPKPSCENKHCTMLPLLHPAVQIEDKDPIPEEQELEAYVDDADIDNEYKRDDFYYFSLEDRERQKREREESKRVLQELKSVLGFKASEAERQKWKQLLFSDHAALKSLPTAEQEKPMNILGLPKNSESGKQDYSRDVNLKETMSDLQTQADNEKGRTEYLSDGSGKSKNDITNSDSPEVEKRTCYQCNGEGEESEPAGVDGVDVLKSSERDVLQSSIKERLSELHRSASFNFTSGLAVQVAARSLTFTSMQEQTFGDEEEEIQENEDFFEKHKGEVNECENEEL
ncbi:vezatin isoform X2 [Rhineura floridana]|uniref:vezatin isoform X2 n=1 Tax=Rhineura floridana TaxID=261503 RepID=UPI002AC875C2|nr:vezatin isoform X2 [Rhineura floridana]